jgi:glyoxylase-like metal-dependent hydrolase (beta-lactamase superfamily II)
MSSFASLVRAPNPGPMTLDGTNTWILAAPGTAARAVVDPGPPDGGHLHAIVAGGPIEAIILTHRHLDHAEGVDALLRLIGHAVPVFAADESLGRDTTAINDGDQHMFGGVAVEVWATPGHTSDSVCLLANDADSGESAIFTGDTILGRGTTVVAWPDGDLRDYLASLERLGRLDGVPVMPGHGPVLADCGQIARDYRAHREGRLDQVRTALAAGARTPAEVVAHVYPDLDPALVPAAVWTVRAALAYLDPP